MPTVMTAGIDVLPVESPLRAAVWQRWNWLASTMSPHAAYAYAYAYAYEGDLR